MGIGVSTSCFYPLYTEEAFGKIALMDVKVCEVFFNSSSELEPSFLKEICKIRDGYGMRVPSIHPFFSFGEPYLLFSEYERRFRDALNFYKKYFDAANILGAKILVMHGGKTSNYVTDELFFERFAKLAAAGREQGITVAQENVVHYRGQSPEYLLKMKEYIGSDFKIVLDIKQAVRAGYSPFDFVGALAENIAHIHISDHAGVLDCLPPGEGGFDFKSLITQMNAAEYKGDYIIELYSHNFKDDNQIINAKCYVEHML